MVGFVVFSSCSDDFLNEEPSGYLTTDQLADMAAKDPLSVLGPLAAGLHNTTFAFGTGGTDSHSDFGQKSIDINLDLMSGDMAMISATYGWFDAVYNYQGQIRTSTEAYKPWRYYYRLINNANEVLDLIGSDEEIPDHDAQKIYFGQAKILRAYSYFYLVNLYQHRYADRKDSPGVPIYRTQLVADIHGQSTVEEVYQFIIFDLTQAIEALQDYKRNNKTYVDQNVAYAYLAYVYLSMGEYRKAIEAADMLINNSAFTLMSATDVIQSGFRSMNIPSWIWGVDLTVDNSPALPTFWGHVDYFTYSYSYAGDAKVIDKDLFTSIPSTDVRKNQFNSSVSSLPELIPYYKFWHQDRQPGSDMQWTSDEVYLRLEEMYLIKAEASARLNEDSDAKTTLKMLLDLRDPVASSALSSYTHEQLLDAIYFNWRVELWGEGKSLFALKRFGKTATRAVNHLRKAGDSFPYNYEYMIFEIPEREQINNPNLVPQN
jgi:tetratricopeptide (TPR) repeat protein